MNRSIATDLLKALSIFGVVFIHGSSLLVSNSNFQTYVSDLFRFCVPCFIIIWAYLFEKSYQKKNNLERKKYIVNKFTHLFTVFFIWSCFYFLNFANWDTITFSKVLTTHFSGYGWAGQYFFIILFQLLLLFPLLRKLYNYRSIRYLLISLLLLLYIYFGYYYETIPDGVKKLGVRPFIFWIPYMFLGISIANQKIKKISVFNVVIILLIPLESFILTHLKLEHDSYITLGVLLASTVMCTAILQNHLIIESKRITDMITLIGKNTMTIFVANPMIIMILSSVIPKKIFQNSILSQLLLPILSTIVILCICLFVSIIINKSKFKGVLN